MGLVHWWVRLGSILLHRIPFQNTLWLQLWYNFSTVILVLILLIQVNLNMRFWSFALVRLSNTLWWENRSNSITLSITYMIIRRRDVVADRVRLVHWSVLILLNSSDWIVFRWDNSRDLLLGHKLAGVMAEIVHHHVLISFAHLFLDDLDEVLCFHCGKINWHVAFVGVWDGMCAADRASGHFKEVQSSSESVNVLLIGFLNLYLFLHLICIS